MFRADISATAAAKIFFGALDEMATNWMLSRRRYSLEADADAVVDLFLNGVQPAAARPGGRGMSIRAVGVSAPAPWARRSPCTWPTPACPSLLLDLTARRRASGPRARAYASSPIRSSRPTRGRLITTGGFDEDLARLADVDWIIEAVVERLDVKRALLARVDGAWRPTAIVSSNTSGIPIAGIAEGRPDELRRALARHALLQSAALSARCSR